ncbi:MAG TPA: CidA/LrgA family protein [Burkholderiaceae bacterium]|nr:CidA/LrgA family protein [Burkholderiaceae bacterium]
MIEGLIKLLAFQLVGEVVVFLLNLPIPGAVLGMALLFIFLVVRKGDCALDTFTTAFLRHLSLLFIPAAVGIVAHLDRIAQEWLAIALALLASTVVAIISTAATLRLLRR